jgi:hypothetical protein
MNDHLKNLLRTNFNPSLLFCSSDKPGAILLWLGSADNEGVKVGLLDVGRSDELPPDLEVSTKDLPRSVFEGVLSTAGCELGPEFGMRIWIMSLALVFGS